MFTKALKAIAVCFLFVQCSGNDRFNDTESLPSGYAGSMGEGADVASYEITNVDSSDFVIFETTSEAKNNIRPDRFHAKYLKLITRATNNLLFYNTKSNTSHKLLDNDSCIIDIYNVNTTKFGPHASKYIIYSIAVEDFNKNNIIDNDDPRALFISSRSGENLQQLSPKGMSVVKWQMPKNDNHLFVLLQNDSNNDLRFAGNDNLEWRLYQLDDLNAQGISVP